eukprot:9245553-Ditylum_brightwellii.AAC.1
MAISKKRPILDPTEDRFTNIISLHKDGVVVNRPLGKMDQTKILSVKVREYKEKKDWLAAQKLQDEIAASTKTVNEDNILLEKV